MNKLILSNNPLNPIKLRHFLKHLTAKKSKPLKPGIKRKLSKKEAIMLYKKLLSLKKELKKIKKKKTYNKKDIEQIKRKIRRLDYSLKT